MTWRELVGTRAYVAGTSGTVTIPLGAFISKIRAVDVGGGGSITIFGGDSIPMIANIPFVIDNINDLWVARTGAADIVFTGTDSYYVEYIKSGNT